MIPCSHQCIDERDVDAVRRVLKSDWLTQGPKIKEFEIALAKYCEAKYAIVVNSGTAALHTAYFAAGLTKGDEFITTPLTFAATANAGLYLGAKPVFADVDVHGNLNPDEVEKKMTQHTKLVSVVDYAGHPAQLNELRAICKKHKLVLVEDACQALGAGYRGKKIGSISDLTTFSFHPVKSITTGEGGAILTNNKKRYETMLRFRTHGITKDKALYKNKKEGDWYHEMHDLGFNYRMTDTQAALGISQLKKLIRFIRARKVIAERYHRAFAELKKYIILPFEDAGIQSAWHLYPIRFKGDLTKKRKEIFSALRKAGIGVQVHHIPTYWHPFYQKLGYKKGLCPRAEDFYQSEISIPIYPGLKVNDQNRVIDILVKIIKNEVISQANM